MLFSVGHSNHTIEHFITLLAGAGVKLLADVRSYPKSRFAPQFNREALERTLPENGIGYLYLGKELGGMTRGKMAREKISREAFEHGLGRLIKEGEQQPTAMTCAERDPLDCHRWLWLTRELIARGIEVRHILANGKIERQRDTEERLLVAEGLGGEDFFPREQRLKDAYRARVSHRTSHRVAAAE